MLLFPLNPFVLVPGLLHQLQQPETGDVPAADQAPATDETETPAAEVEAAAPAAQPDAPLPEAKPVPADQIPPAEEKADPIEALSETAETATSAVSEFVSWVGTGQREALVAIVLTVGITCFLAFLRYSALKGLVRLPESDDYSVGALIRRVVARFHTYFMVAVALAITDALLPLPSEVSGFVRIFFVLAAVLQVAEWLQQIAIGGIQRNLHRQTGDVTALASAFNVIKWFINFAIWTVALLLILDNVGADVTALLAGLGIGGIAIGIAAQGIFRDLFSSISIVLDKPFQIGDTIRYGETWGDIEDIGLKTTRIRAKSGEQIIISNTNLLEHEIHNMRRMSRRRIETGFGVIYQTDPDLADRIPTIVAETVKGVEGVVFDRCGMSGFGPSSLDYSLVFYSLNPDFNRSMAARSRVLLALLRELKAKGIEFAYPTQTLYIEGMGATQPNH
ncbi:MAG: mechanosensitive ion channel domain-containing protein [Pseudomonadota bacterium]